MVARDVSAHSRNLHRDIVGNIGWQSHFWVDGTNVWIVVRDICVSHGALLLVLVCQSCKAILLRALLNLASNHWCIFRSAGGVGIVLVNILNKLAVLLVVNRLISLILIRVLIINQTHWILKNLSMCRICKDTVGRARHSWLVWNNVNLSTWLLNELALIQLNQLLSTLLIWNTCQELTWGYVFSKRIGIDWWCGLLTDG